MLRALRESPGVLLVDEIDRADDEFEAFPEVLSTWSVTIPELGTVVAATPPVVVLTSNRTRELHDALNGGVSITGWSILAPNAELAIVPRAHTRGAGGPCGTGGPGGARHALRHRGLLKPPGSPRPGLGQALQTHWRP